ncbi:uncharacterized protein [Nicotiana tomentosiformis]|uniref:uncharacterized protein n=1 Tax=Nicotiana tomentosiformis TaxID=4098 RepID=UPI00388C42D5
MAIEDVIHGTTSTNATGTSNPVYATTGGSVFPTIGHNHPLYLQPTDTPGSSLISLELVGAENYALWSRAMRIGLLGKSKLGFVDGRYLKSRFAPELHDLLEKVNIVVLSWIMNVVRPVLLSIVLYASSAYKVLEDLREMFDKVNGSRVQLLHKEIHSFSQGTMTVQQNISPRSYSQSGEIGQGRTWSTLNACREYKQANSLL